jgi:hypothetical protein
MPDHYSRKKKWANMRPNYEMDSAEVSDMSKTRIRFALFILIVAVWSTTVSRAADTLSSQLSDDAFWKLIENPSEAGGSSQSENFLSNETGFQIVIPTLSLRVPPGGVYMGVGLEQIFRTSGPSL